jgi:hypothetical protein
VTQHHLLLHNRALGCCVCETIESNRNLLCSGVMHVVLLHVVMQDGLNIYRICKVPASAYAVLFGSSRRRANMHWLLGDDTATYDRGRQPALAR